MSDTMNTQMIDFEKEGIVVERQTDSGHLTLSEFEEKLNTPGVSRQSDLQGRKLPRASLPNHGQNVDFLRDKPSTAYSSRPRTESFTSQREADNEIKRKLRGVIRTGSGFVNMPTQVISKPKYPTLGFNQRTVLAKIQVGIDGRQLKENGVPKLENIGWTFRWRLVPLDKSSRQASPDYSRHIPLKVNIVPDSGTHNLIHVTGQTVEKSSSGLEPKISAYGISGEIGNWKNEAERTSSEFTTFSPSGKTNPGQVDWSWQKIDHSQTLRDPDLTYFFGFRFSFEEPFDVETSVPGLADSVSDEVDDEFAVDVSLCDLGVTWEKSHFFSLSPVTLKAPGASLATFRSDECDMPLKEVWPIAGTEHVACAGCLAVSASA